MMALQMRSSIRCTVVIVALALLVMPAAIARAGTGGNEDIGGTVISRTYYYQTERQIKTPSSSGPDIAALKYAGPSYMELGAHDCLGDIFVGSPTVLSTIYYFGLTGDGSTNGGEIFCLFTHAGSGGSTGTFTANLDWD